MQPVIHATSQLQFQTKTNRKNRKSPTLSILTKNMSSDNDPCPENNFKLVLYKGKKKSRKLPPPSIHAPHLVRADLTNKDSVLRRVHEAKVEIKSSDLLASALASLREGTETLSHPKIKEIVCFGLGNIGDSLTSKYQLALLLCLRDVFDVDVRLYDPAFTQLDHWILEQCLCKVFEENFEAKFRVEDGATRIFFLPHCTPDLTNNLLWANWGRSLNYCIIIANSINSIVEKRASHKCEETTYITNIAPHMVELALINSFKFYDIFNNTAIHIFPWDRLKLLTEDFWSFRPEPQYDIAKRLQSGLFVS